VVASALTSIELPLVCPQLTCAIPNKNKAVQIRSRICTSRRVLEANLGPLLRKLNGLRLDCGLIASKQLRFFVSAISCFGLSKPCHVVGGCLDPRLLTLKRKATHTRKLDSLELALKTAGKAKHVETSTDGEMEASLTPAASAALYLIRCVLVVPRG